MARFVLIPLVLAACQMAASEVKVPKLKLNDGYEMPAIALGTYLGFDKNGIIKSQNNQVRDIVVRAIDVGYRHFDTASVYQTETEVGEGIAQGIRAGKLGRGDVFVTTKLWNTHHKREQVTKALNESLKNLGMEYVDLYLMHWPIGVNEDYSYSDVDFMETWRGMEDVRAAGLARSIGLSNFNQEQLQRVLNESSVKPSVLQIEIHPQIVQSSMVSFAQAQGLVVMGYSPFGSLVARFGAPGLRQPVLGDIAAKRGKTPAQIVLRWLVDRNVVPIPKTVNPKRLEENINIFDFHLDEDEIKKISALDSHLRYTLPSFWQNHPYYPFEKVDNPIANPFGK